MLMLYIYTFILSTRCPQGGAWLIRSWVYSPAVVDSNLLMAFIFENFLTIYSELWMKIYQGKVNKTYEISRGTPSGLEYPDEFQKKNIAHGTSNVPCEPNNLTPMFSSRSMRILLVFFGQLRLTVRDCHRIGENGLAFTKHFAWIQRSSHICVQKGIGSFVAISCWL